MRDKLSELLKPQVDSDVKLSVVSLFIGKMIEAVEERLRSLESRQLQRGEKGDKGEKGERGLPGKDGANGRDGVDGQNGRAGLDGKNGKNGAKGKDGVSITGVEVALDNHLVVKMSDGKIIDAGEIYVDKNKVHLHSTVHEKPQITVSATPPPNPQINDLWYDIS